MGSARFTYRFGDSLLKMLERFWFGCGHCDGGASCPFASEMEAAAKSPRIGMARLPIPLTAAMVFLFPLACAIAVGYLVSEAWAGETFRSECGWQALGGLGGLVVGVLIARLTLTILDRVWINIHRGGA